jgi:hypothetical protein
MSEVSDWLEQDVAYASSPCLLRALEQWPLNGICTGAHTTDAAINTQTAMVERWCAFESGLTAEKYGTRC